MLKYNQFLVSRSVIELKGCHGNHLICSLMFIQSTWWWQLTKVNRISKILKRCHGQFWNLNSQTGTQQRSSVYSCFYHCHIKIKCKIETENIHIALLCYYQAPSTKYPYFTTKFLALSFTFTDHSDFSYKPNIMVEGPFENDYRSQFPIHAHGKP